MASAGRQGCLGLGVALVCLLHLVLAGAAKLVVQDSRPLLQVGQVQGLLRRSQRRLILQDIEIVLVDGIDHRILAGLVLALLVRQGQIGAASGRCAPFPRQQ